mmetsp:Transcript_41986/g.69419  ORF Transcript_41986/g.69419 Transcript_41986/m.69419 type:complete len:224 (+) Transcript_41986:877-1548(+)
MSLAKTCWLLQVPCNGSPEKVFDGRGPQVFRESPGRAEPAPNIGTDPPDSPGSARGSPGDTPREPLPSLPSTLDPEPCGESECNPCPSSAPPPAKRAAPLAKTSLGSNGAARAAVAAVRRLPAVPAVLPVEAPVPPPAKRSWRSVRRLLLSTDGTGAATGAMGAMGAIGAMATVAGSGSGTMAGMSGTMAGTGAGRVNKGPVSGWFPWLKSPPPANLCFVSGP